MRQNWFNRTTLPLRLTPYCECRTYPGRTHCFGCTITEDQIQRPPKYSTQTVFTAWWERWLDTSILSVQDTNFLLGIKPTYGRKKPWKRSWA